LEKRKRKDWSQAEEEFEAFGKRIDGGIRWILREENR